MDHSRLDLHAVAAGASRIVAEVDRSSGPTCRPGSGNPHEAVDAAQPAASIASTSKEIVAAEASVQVAIEHGDSGIPHIEAVTALLGTALRAVVAAVPALQPGSRENGAVAADDVRSVSAGE